MSKTRYEKLTNLFLAALDRSPETRSAWVAAECGGDEDLRRSLEKMLSAHEITEGILDRSPFGLFDAPTLGQSPGGNEIPEVGKFRLLRAVGRGGMGTVFEAERTDVPGTKPVAVKVLQSLSGGDIILKRFRSEYRILANLDHPNISRLYDGGLTEQGIPYFVMEFISGRPIDDYCDERGLATRERLELFLKVCDAIGYAHRNLVVHRDIKPGNILVTGEGVPKLLDFGIAKIIRPEGAAAPPPLDATRDDGVAMTPLYASPEQMRGESVTTAVDVYALGVLLCKVLTGKVPYRLAPAATFEDLRRAILDLDPVCPSDLAPGRDLRGDLDAIVRKTLEKEPSRRYASVEQLAADIRRHLDGLPISVRGDSFSYRAVKFIRRHRRGAVIAGTVAVVVTVSLTVSVWQSIRAARARDREEAQRRISEERARDVREIARTLLYQVHDDVEKLAGSTPVRQSVVSGAVRFLDRLSRQGDADPMLQMELALAYRRAGDVQGRPNASNLGDTAGALASYRKSLAILDTLQAARSDDTAIRSELATANERVGEVLAQMGQRRDALAHFGRTRGIREDLLAADPRNPERRRLMADCYTRIADNLLNEMEYGEVARLLEDTLVIREALVRETPNDPDLQRALATVYRRISWMCESAADLGVARTGRAAWTDDLYRQAIVYNETLTRLFAERLKVEPATPALRRDFASCCFRTGITRLKIEDVPKAVADLELARTEFVRLAAEDPQNLSYRMLLAWTRKYECDAKAASRRYRAAMTGYQAVIREFDALVALNPENVELRRCLADACDGLAGSLAALDLAPEGVQAARRALSIRKALSAADPSHGYIGLELYRTYRHTLSVLRRCGLEVEAKAVALEQLETYRQRVEARYASVWEFSEYGWLLASVSSPDRRGVNAAVTYVERADTLGNRNNLAAALSLARVGTALGDSERTRDAVLRFVGMLPLTEPARADAVHHILEALRESRMDQSVSVGHSLVSPK